MIELQSGSIEKTVIRVLDKNKIKEAINSKEIEKYLENEFLKEVLY